MGHREGLWIEVSSSGGKCYKRSREEEEQENHLYEGNNKESHAGRAVNEDTKKRCIG